MDMLKKFRYNYNYWLKHCLDPKSSLAKTIKNMDETETSPEEFDQKNFERKIEEKPDKYLIIDLYEHGDNKSIVDFLLKNAQAVKNHKGGAVQF